MAISGSENRYWDLKTDPTANDNLIVHDDIEAFIGTFYNIFRTKVGDRGATFRPDFGNYMSLLLHEPINNFTAFRMKTFLFEDIRRWQPLAKLDIGKTKVIPVLASRYPGYNTTIAVISTPVINTPFSFTFTAIPS